MLGNWNRTMTFSTNNEQWLLLIHRNLYQHLTSWSKADPLNWTKQDEF